MSGLELILIRHPRPAGGDGVCYGRLDLPPAEPVTAAADRLRPLLAACGVDLADHQTPLYSSPLQRCHRLAAALHPAPSVDDRLAEMHFGAWEGQPWDQVPRAELDAWAADIRRYTPPGGESPEAVLARALDWVAEVSHQPVHRQAPVVAVSHAGPIRLLLCHWLGLPLSAWNSLQLDCGQLTRLHLSRHGGAQLLACNL